MDERTLLARLHLHQGDRRVTTGDEVDLATGDPAAAGDNLVSVRLQMSRDHVLPDLAEPLSRSRQRSRLQPS